MENMTKVKYYREKNRFYLFIIISVILIIFLLVSFIAYGINWIEIAKSLVIVGIVTFIICYGKKLEKEAFEYVNERKEIVQKGKKCTGKIIEIKKDVSNIDYRVAHRLVAQYYSPIKNENIVIESPALQNAPSDKIGMNCIIYEYKDKAIIDKVEELEKKKMNKADWIASILIFIFFVFALYFTILNQ